MQTNGQISPPSIPAAWRKACCVTFVFFFLASHGRLSHSYTARVLSNIHTYIYYIYIYIFPIHNIYIIYSYTQFIPSSLGALG